MSTKYSISPTESWRQRTCYRLTDHALTRWDERTPEGSISPEAAFEAAVQCPDIRAHFSDIDEVWLYADTVPEFYVVVFLVAAYPEQTYDNVVTVIDSQTIQSRPVRAFLHAAAAATTT